jgi:hypothetical protein
MSAMYVEPTKTLSSLHRSSAVMYVSCSPKVTETHCTISTNNSHIAFGLYLHRSFQRLHSHKLLRPHPLAVPTNDRTHKNGRISPQRLIIHHDPRRLPALYDLQLATRRLVPILRDHQKLHVRRVFRHDLRIQRARKVHARDIERAIIKRGSVAPVSSSRRILIVIIVALVISTTTRKILIFDGARKKPGPL